MQSTTLLDPWPTSRIWLLRQEHTATPAPALQCDTEPTSSHLEERAKEKNKSAVGLSEQSEVFISSV